MTSSNEYRRRVWFVNWLAEMKELARQTPNPESVGFGVCRSVSIEKYYERPDGTIATGTGGKYVKKKDRIIY